MYRILFLVFLMPAVLSQPVWGQEYPEKIRGYKVKKAEIAVNDRDSGADRFVTVKFGEPEVGSVSVTGISLLFQSKILVSGQSGTIDFLSFKDFEVNGIKVEIEEFVHEFDFEKNRETEMPGHVEVFIGSGQILKGAYSELKEAKQEWRVRGRVFVFGKFRKFGFKFKRVIPVDVDFRIKNPLLRKPESAEPAGNTGGETGIVEQQRYV